MVGFISKSVPNADSTDNYSFIDVIGNKEDKSFSNANNWNPSIAGALKANYYHVHDSAKVYPTLDDPVTVTAGVGSWVLGDFVEIVPVNAITKWFDVHWVLISGISANDDYELVLYKGASESEEEIGRISFVRNAAQSQEGNQPIQIPPQLPNTRISAKLASATGSNTAKLKLYYHTYPDIEV
jgi:hypothetical protein